MLDVYEPMAGACITDLCKIAWRCLKDCYLSGESSSESSGESSGTSVLVAGFF